MAEPERKRLRLSPRTSNAVDEVIMRGADTPYNDLHALANVVNQKPITPQRRASTVDITPNTGNNRTPVSRTPRSNLHSRPVIARRGPPTTPHAIRALQQRRNAALTPRAQRRRSGRVQRETPRDTLRALSRIMAKKSEPVEPPPQVQETAPRPRNAALDDFDEGPDVQPPRLSLALDEYEDEDDDDSFHAPPRLSSAALEDLDDFTARSFEAGRRAFSEDPRGRFSIGINDLGRSPEHDVDGTFIRSNIPGDEDDIMIEDGTIQLGEDATGDLSALLSRRRQSELGLGEAGDDTQDEPTFQINIPQRSRPLPTAPAIEIENEDGTVGFGADDENWEDQDEDHDGAPGLEMEIGRQEDDPRFFSPPVSEPELDIDIEDARAQAETGVTSPKAAKKPRKTKEAKYSKHGIQYPSLPPAVVKKLALSFLRQNGHSNPRIGKDVLGEILQTTEWFFEQVGVDLAEYANHAKRKKIEEADVVCLMKRQRQLNANTTPFSLAQKYLPRELLQDIRMPPPAKLKGAKRKRLETIEEGNEDE